MTQAKTRESKVLRWFFVSILLASLCFGCVASIIAIAVGGFRDEQITQRVIVIPTIGVLCGCIGLVGTVMLGRRRFVVFTRIMLGLLLVTSGSWLVLLWVLSSASSSETVIYLRIGGAMTAVVVGMMLIAHLLDIETKSSLVKGIALAIVVLTAVYVPALIMTICTTWWTPWGMVVGQTISIGGMAILISAIGLPAVARSLEKKRRKVAESIASKVILALSCPRCGKEQQLPTGLTRCADCKTALIIEIEEPRCECGYLLYQLQGETCPECGREIPQADR